MASLQVETVKHPQALALPSYLLWYHKSHNFWKFGKEPVTDFKHLLPTVATRITF